MSGAGEAGSPLQAAAHGFRGDDGAAALQQGAETVRQKDDGWPEEKRGCKLGFGAKMRDTMINNNHSDNNNNI